MMPTAIVILLVVLSSYFFRHWLIDRLMQASFFLARCWCRAKRKTIKVADIRWCYLEAGKQEKPTLLLIHGFGVDKYNWLPYLSQWLEDFHIIVPDLPAFGETRYNHKVHSFTVEEQVARLAHFVDALKLDSFHLAGNSMGGLIAGMYCLTHQHKVKTLSLKNAVGLLADKESFLFSTFDQGEYTLIPQTVEEGQALVNNLSAKPQKVPRFFLRYLLRKQALNRDTLEAIYGHVIGYQRNAILHKELHKLTLPVLVMWGKEDKLLDVSGGENAMEFLVNGRLIVLDNVGHAPMMEMPKLTADHHKQFINDNN